MFLDHNILANQIWVGTWCWFAVRVSVVSVFVMGVCTVICILFRFEEEPVLIAMTLSYIIQLENYLIFMLYQMGDLERCMVSIQRCFQMLEIPQEKETS